MGSIIRNENLKTEPLEKNPLDDMSVDLIEASKGISGSLSRKTTSFGDNVPRIEAPSQAKLDV